MFYRSNATLRRGSKEVEGITLIASTIKWHGLHDYPTQFPHINWKISEDSFDQIINKKRQISSSIWLVADLKKANIKMYLRFNTSEQAISNLVYRISLMAWLKGDSMIKRVIF